MKWKRKAKKNLFEIKAELYFYYPSSRKNIRNLNLEPLFNLSLVPDGSNLILDLLCLLLFTTSDKKGYLGLD